MLRKKMLVLCLAMGVSGMASAGEFLDGQQMGDLVLHGQMTGADGARYDVWIVPGYSGPLDNAAAGWRAAGHDLGEYAEAKLYENIVDTSGDMLKFAGKTAIVNFAFKGSADAWVDAFSTAQQRVNRQVFGWWFAYPWAVIEASGESVLRIVIGVPGGVLVAGLGTTVVPAVQFAWPAAKGVYHGVIKGTALPVAAAAWNTVIAPPMALTGSPPTQANADGFWMTRQSVVEKAKVDPEMLQVRKELQLWRKALVNSVEVQAVQAEAKEFRRVYYEKRQQQLKALDDARDMGEKQLEAKRVAIILEKAGQADSYSNEDRTQLASMLQRYGKGQIIDVLRGDGISVAQAEALLAVLVTPEALAVAPVVESPAGHAPEKTDPLKRALEKQAH